MTKINTNIKTVDVLGEDFANPGMSVEETSRAEMWIHRIQVSAVR